ncbi:MAG TPA: toxin TcdB middle/N-terminal domain-containing protein, partial [Candidatus Hydrogenedentes bacterium]|nr:toxin TcdB middle/N-terminal domain-containing protein [Candidatus Hydrogenedentota bacterium]
MKPQVLSLPSGPGSIEGLGESFEPQLNSGTVTYAIKLKTAPGCNGFTPELVLSYNGGFGNGLFGLGWTLKLFSVKRQTDKGFPGYDDTDTFVSVSGEELVRVGDGVYREKNESSFTRFERSGDGWIARLCSGGAIRMGMTDAARLVSEGRIFEWMPEEQTDANGNTLRYEYTRFDGSPLPCLTRIVYNENGTHRQEVLLNYGPRPDPFSDYRSTFRVETSRRCVSVSIISDDVLVRRYDLAYISSGDIFVSMLASVTEVGADGKTALPPASFTYTESELSAARVITMAGPKSGGTPPWVPLATEPDATLNDMNGDGLPDLVVAKPREHYVYPNIGIGQDGNHRWGRRQDMGEAASPDEALGNDGVSLADINGDGLTDFIARRSQDTYFLWRNTGADVWGKTETFANTARLPFDFENSALRLLDVNNDKKTDVMYCEDPNGDGYRYYLNNGAAFDKVVNGGGLGGAMTFDQRPGMKLADMNGDGLQDIVLLENGLCIYWPMSGTGTWDKTRRGNWADGEAGTGVKMAAPPDDRDEQALSFDWAALMLFDVNGDGLTDVVYVPDYADRAVYWLNRDSLSFSEPREIHGLPRKDSLSTVQPADMNGNGTTDLLWNYPENAGDQDLWRYVDFFPTEKPYLLKTVSNGIGKTTTFHYASAAAEYARDREGGRQWPNGVPVPVNVLSSFDINDGLVSYTSEIYYHDGYYDGREREFRGFAAATRRELGDSSLPDLFTDHIFDTGAAHEVLKGKTLSFEARTAEKGGAGVFFQERNEWEPRQLLAGAAGETRTVNFAAQTVRERTVVEEGRGVPVTVRWEYDYDAYGNRTWQQEFGRLDGAWDDERVTETTYTAADATGLSAWILNKVVTQTTKDENGVLVAEKRSYY